MVRVVYLVVRGWESVLAFWSLVMDGGWLWRKREREERDAKSCLLVLHGWKSVHYLRWMFTTYFHLSLRCFRARLGYGKHGCLETFSERYQIGPHHQNIPYSLSISRFILSINLLNIPLASKLIYNAQLWGIVCGGGEEYSEFQIYLPLSPFPHSLND